MYSILSAQFIAPDVKLLHIEAPHIARKHQAGQFVILRVTEEGERIPITIADSDPEKGIISVIVQGIGLTTKQLNLLEKGDSLPDLVGPLGRPSIIDNWGRVIIVCGGVGTAEALPSAKAMKAAGNEIIAIIGARTKELIIAEELMVELCDEVIITTDDGTYGRKGFVTSALEPLLSDDDPPQMVMAIGPLPMMSAVAELTRPLGIKTTVSLNTIMVDGTGMCGSCRATIGGKTVFVCVDGPEFDAHQVNFNELIKRSSMYRDQEKRSLVQFLDSHQVDSHTKTGYSG